MKGQFGVENCHGSWQGRPGWSEEAPTKGQTAHEAFKAGSDSGWCSGETGHSEGGQSAWARPGGQKTGRRGRRQKGRAVWSRVGMPRCTGGLERQTGALVLGLLGPGHLGRECSQLSFQKLKTASRRGGKEQGDGAML